MSESYSICKNKFLGNMTVVQQPYAFSLLLFSSFSTLCVCVCVFEWIDRNQEKEKRRQSHEIHKRSINGYFRTRSKSLSYQTFSNVRSPEGDDYCTPPHMRNLYYIERIRKQASKNAKNKTVFLVQRLCVNSQCQLKTKVNKHRKQHQQNFTDQYQLHQNISDIFDQAKF